MAAPLPAYAAYKHFLVTSPSTFVAHVEINRPAKLNAFYQDMWLEIRRVFAQLSTDPDVRAVVLTGAGDRAFTAGLDVQAASQDTTLQGGQSGVDGARKAVYIRRDVTEFQECITEVEKCEKRKEIVVCSFFPCRRTCAPSLHCKLFLGEAQGFFAGTYVLLPGRTFLLCFTHTAVSALTLSKSACAWI
jgi:hypothetical protein